MLPDGVELRLRYIVDDCGVMQTQYRISSRWQLPSPYNDLVSGVKRVINFFVDRPHLNIPFEPPARQLLLGAQLEQGLLVSACRGEEGAGEAQHGAAAGQIGVWAALARILRMAAGEEPAGTGLAISEEDVELSRRVVNISLGIKWLARQPDLAGNGYVPDAPSTASARGPGRNFQI